MKFSTITESGCGYLDGPYDRDNGRIPDTRRIEWYRQVLAELARAIADGARVRAYHAWSLLDNFQWAEGHTERYGLIHTDFRSQERSVKDSGFWYSRVAASNRLDVQRSAAGEAQSRPLSPHGRPPLCATLVRRRRKSFLFQALRSNTGPLA